MNNIKDTDSLTSTMTPFLAMVVAFAISTYVLSYIGLEWYKDYKAAGSPRLTKWHTRILSRLKKLRTSGSYEPPDLESLSQTVDITRSPNESGYWLPYPDPLRMFRPKHKEEEPPITKLGTGKTVANEETDVPSLPATNADKIKGLSKVLESGLRDVLALVEDDYPLSTALETTVDTFEEHLAEVARCISPEFSTAEKPSRNSSKAVSDDISGDFENVLPTVGQKRRLVSLHGAYLTVIFRLLAEHLLRNENTLEAQIPDIQDVAAGLTLVVKAFDANWERLKLDHRVAEKPEIPKKVITERPNNPKEGPPDMWCAIAQARALLALALARAALITSDKDAVGSVIDELVGGGLATVSKTGHRHTAATLGVARAKEHLAEAKSLANWTWWNRKLCSKKAKEAVVHWQDWFWPIYGMIEDGIAYARSERSEFGEDVLLEPVFVGPVQVKVRWDYQFTDVSVGYGYDSC
ncbi:hypothetical protein OHC33_007575 [Knufia fluminis]|uniref:Uncharacterized protein n=1 Tax=Knufia fluminis TaxID=191047 RepID=A0AAN8EBK4_9EURO|nr:hypothetical protein OHC33_007575 [Knufia fluminis]